MASAMALVIGPPPATADDTMTVRLELPKDATPIARIVVDGSRKPITHYTVRTEIKGTKQYSVLTAKGPVVDYCELYASPAPTYSATVNKMQWGAQIICNGVTHLRIRMQLYSGPNKMFWQHNTQWTYAVGAGHSQNMQKTCLDWGNFTDWELDPYAEVDWDITNTWMPFAPYPGYVPVRSQQCMDIQ